jgi:hypothetical protein
VGKVFTSLLRSLRLIKNAEKQSAFVQIHRFDGELPLHSLTLPLNKNEVFERVCSSFESSRETERLQLGEDALRDSPLNRVIHLFYLSSQTKCYDHHLNDKPKRIR